MTAHRAPVVDALVAADCGRDYGEPSLRTDASGRARLSFRHGEVDASKCSVIVAKPGYPTVETSGVQLCTTPECPALHVELGETYADHVSAPRPQPREYAYPPRRMEVAE